MSAGGFAAGGGASAAGPAKKARPDEPRVGDTQTLVNTLTQGAAALRQWRHTIGVVPESVTIAVASKIPKGYMNQKTFWDNSPIKRPETPDNKEHLAIRIREAASVKPVFQGFGWQGELPACMSEFQTEPEIAVCNVCYHPPEAVETLLQLLIGVEFQLNTEEPTADTDRMADECGHAKKLIDLIVCRNLLDMQLHEACGMHVEEVEKAARKREADAEKVVVASSDTRPQDQPDMADIVQTMRTGLLDMQKHFAGTAAVFSQVTALLKEVQAKQVQMEAMLKQVHDNTRRR